MLSSQKSLFQYGGHIIEQSILVAALIYDLHKKRTDVCPRFALGCHIWRATRVTAMLYQMIPHSGPASAAASLLTPAATPFTV